MKEHKKIYNILLIIFFIVLIILGGTYALSLWRSTENTMLTLRIGDISGIYCEVGNEINVSNLGPVFDYQKDGEIFAFSIDNKTNEATSITAKFNIKSITDNLKEDSFKYTLLYSTDNITYNILKEESFKNISNKITLLDNYTIPLSSKLYFKFIIYIDGNMENPISMQGGSLVGSISLCKEETEITRYYMKGNSGTFYYNNFINYDCFNLAFYDECVACMYETMTNFLNTDINPIEVSTINVVKFDEVPDGVGNPIDISRDTDNSVLLYKKVSSKTADYINNLYDLYIATENGKVFLTNGLMLFQYMINLESVDLIDMYTDEVTDMSGMFAGCQSLTSFDLSNFNTSNVTNMSGMFATVSGGFVEETKITSLDLSNFDTSNVTDMSGMFYGMGKLTSLNINNFNTSKVTNMKDMFNNLSSLTSLNLSNFNTSNVTNMSGMFRNMSRLASLDVSNFDTSKVTNMADMFFYVNSLTSLNLSNFDTSNVTNMSGMFRNISRLTSLNISNFDTSKVTNMSYMFSGVSSLTSIDLSNFNTSNVTNMSYMFGDMSGLTSIDLSNFNTSNVTNMSYMFNDMSGLTTLNINNFNTSNVTNMRGMFSGVSSVTSLYLNYFKTSKVSDMSSMFSYMSSLLSLDINDFDTSNVTDMSSMFRGISSIASLDISNFNTANVTSMNYMFSGMSKLVTIYTGNKFNTSKVAQASSSSMFSDCPKLTGGNGTRYDSSHVDKTYARIDASGTPGYFTAR